MKKIKKVLAVVLALAMTMAMGVTAFGQNANGDTNASGKGTITIANASKGEKYNVYKLFSATVSTGGISYTGTVPDGLKDYFELKNGNIVEKTAARDGDNMSDGLKTALTNWAKTATAVVNNDVESDGTSLVFNNLEYGYYVVTSTQSTKYVTVDSTNPSVTVYDKNVTSPSIDKTDGKKADKTDVSIGETVTYTITFKTSNYDGQGENAKQIVSYTINDTLPDFLSDVTVTSIKIKNAEYKVSNLVPQFDNKKITIPWVEGDKSLYDNGSEVVITYTAKVNDKAAIAGNGNKNEVTLTWKDKGDETEKGGGDEYKSSEIIYTYAIGIKKINEKGEALKGATFEFPFAVANSKDSDGYYVADASAETQKATIATPEDGVIIIKGVKSGSYTVKETVAPEGYNNLGSEQTVTAQKLSATTTSITKYIDKDGEIVDSKTEETTDVTYTNANIAADVLIVVNKAGKELPETGGMGTTLFYMIGSVLVLGAGVVMITRRRMGTN